MRIGLSLLIGAMLTTAAWAEEVHLNGHRFTLAEGYAIEQIGGPPLVNRPISADFDELGRLYVTDSSGSNENVRIQLEKRPHRVVRLEDVDGDGRFDKSTVFADQLMFPEGALWFDGSLYVAAPEIWKFTDGDDDGVAEEREIWFDGKTLTNCANDLHGPYLGPDGWIYWCKGAFAAQTYDRPGREPLQTRAAHIFRRHPRGRTIESVMTGGMDNPVEVVFTAGGERIFTTTFLMHPSQGQRDGLIHAAYGGVYGKDHGVLDGHPRTGPLMPVLDHLGAAAPCGLARLETPQGQRGFQDQLLACSFNMHKITRHVLSAQGATFASRTDDLLISDNLDFHPTDVLQDADGSVVVVDTGGWYRLCCPTSQLEKPDVLGGLYRIRRIGAAPVADPRGREIDWDHLNDARLVQLLNDERFAVRNQARRRIAACGARLVAPLGRIVAASQDPNHRLQAVWTLAWIDGREARAAVRRALRDANETVRQAALHSVSVHRDKEAVERLTDMIQSGPPHNRRAAAEALGRVGSPVEVARLLAATATAIQVNAEGGETVDRFLEHALIYAVIELREPAAIRPMLAAADPRVRRAALIALDQLEGGDHLAPEDVQPLLGDANNLLNETAWWLAEQHPDWGEFVAAAFRNDLGRSSIDQKSLQRIGERLQRFAKSAAVRQVMADVLADSQSDLSVRVQVLRAMAGSRQTPLPAVWLAPLRLQLSSPSREVLGAALLASQQLSDGQLDEQTVTRLQAVGDDLQQDPEIRLRALRSLPANARSMSDARLDFLCSQLTLDSSVAVRALAVDVLTTAPLNSEQLQQVARQLPHTGAMELRPLLEMFAKSGDEKLGVVLTAALLNAPAATLLLPDQLNKYLIGFGDQVLRQAEPLLAKIEQQNRNKLQRVEEVLNLLPTADVRRGLRVFQSSKASCTACHVRGYLGGNIGPDLNRIGRIRSERDLLESILFPSLSFVRSFEPVSMVTNDGRVFNGVIRDETDDAVVLQLDAQKSVRISKSDIEQRRHGATSIMPAGLEKQLSPQDLADMVKYLKEG